MFEETPWIPITLLVIPVLLIILGITANRTMKASGISIFSVIHKKSFRCRFFTGLACSLFGAFLMFNGELFGDNTTGIARIIGIVGICLTAPVSPTGIALKKMP